MAETKFLKKFNSFLESETINESDFYTYVKLLADQTKLLEHIKGFHVYAPVVKKWIAGFETIFNESKIEEAAKFHWQTYTSTFCKPITKTFFILLQSFRQFDPEYTQVFYAHWKTIVSRMDGLKRAETFGAYIDKFKVMVQHLRTAEQRSEQFVILLVLQLYVERVPIDDLEEKLIENDNGQIVHKIAQLMVNPTILKQHEFLQDMNALGHCIETLKPKKIICRRLKIECDNSEHEMWLDFNKKDKTIVFMTVNLADQTNQNFAIGGGSIKLRENLYDDRMLEINGHWSVMRCSRDLIQKRVTVKVFLLSDVKSSISKPVANVFRFVNAGDSGSASHGFTTGTGTAAEDEPTKIVIKAAAQPENTQPLDDSMTSDILPRPIQLERAERRFSLPAQPKSLPELKTLNSSWPLFPLRRNIGALNMTSIEDQHPIYPNVADVIQESRRPSTNGIVTDERHSSDPNRTYVLRETVNPIAPKQSENDLPPRSDNYDVISMDIEGPPIERFNGNESRATYTIKYGALSNISTEAKRLPGDYADNVSSELSSMGYVSEYDIHLDVRDLDIGESYSNNGWNRSNQCTGKNKIEILENITIVPAMSQTDSRASSDYIPRKGTVQFFHLSQMDERIITNRADPFSAYSQPITSRERFFIKDTPNPWYDITEIQPNESSPRESIGEVLSAQGHSESGSDVLMDESMRNIIKRSMGPANRSSKKSKRANQSTQFGTQKSQQTQTMFSSQNQFESFFPLATSTQQLPFNYRGKLSQNLVETSLSQSADVLRSSVEESSYRRSMTQNSSQQRSVPIIIRSQAASQEMPKFVNMNKLQQHTGPIITRPQSASQEMPKALNVNKSQNRTRANKTTENVLADHQQGQIYDASFIPSIADMKAAQMMNSLSSQVASSAPLRATQSNLSADTDPRKMLRLSQKSGSQSSAVSTQNALRNATAAEIITIEDLPEDTESTQQRTKMLRSQFRPALVSAPHSSQIQAASVSTQNSSQKPVLEPFETVTIIDLPEDTESPQKRKRMSRSPVHSACVSTQNSSTKPATTAIPEPFEAVTIVDLPEDTESPQKRMKMSQIHSASVSKSDLSHKKATSSTAQRAEDITIADLPSDTESLQCALDLSQKSRSQDLESASIRKPATAVAPDLHEIVTIADPPEDVQKKPTEMSRSLFQTATQKQTNSSQQSRMPQATPANQRKVTFKLDDDTSLQADNARTSPVWCDIGESVAAKAAKRKSRLSKWNKKRPVRKTTEKETVSSIRYSSLKRNRVATGAANSSIEHENAANHLDEQNNSATATDSVRIADSGMIHDGKGCVFTDDAELQRATKFYIANNGLDYLKTHRFNSMAANKREKYERKLRVVHEMINHGLEKLHANDEHQDEVDPYSIPIKETIVQRGKQKSISRLRKVNVTVSEQKTTVDKSSNDVMIERRVRKMLYIVEEDGIDERKNRRISNSGTETVATPRPAMASSTVPPDRENESTSISDVPVTSAKVNAKSSSTDRPSETPKKLPIYASDKMKTKHQYDEVTSTVQTGNTPVKLPIYASDEMIAANHKKKILSTVQAESDQLPTNTKPPSRSADRFANVSMEEPIVTVDPPESMDENPIEVSNLVHSEMDERLCSTMTCNQHLKDLMSRLNRFVEESYDMSEQQVLIEFIDRLELGQLQQNPPLTECLQLFNGVLSLLESVGVGDRN